LGLAMNNTFKELIGNKTHDKLINYSYWEEKQLSIPTPEHYLPLLYIGFTNSKEDVSFFNDKAVINLNDDIG
jgi:aromatic ring-opening dioxygenase catalytic subunit (LigB family)